jgi:glycosyltransferase involved in cell wall biosynthesis
LLLKEIESMRSQGFRIVNLGWCSKRDLQAEYQKASFLVYPSNMESFGLGLIEAAQFGMRILAADLPYVSAVIAPSLTIDQENPAAIAKAMLAAMQVELPVAKVVVENRVAEMTAILSA